MITFCASAPNHQDLVILHSPMLPVPAFPLSRIKRTVQSDSVNSTPNFSHHCACLSFAIYNMCRAECFGNQHRGCGHYVRLYYSGETKDCGSPDCGLSPNHRHKTAKNCGCKKEYDDNRRVLNLIQAPCDDCIRSVLPSYRDRGY